MGRTGKEPAGNSLRSEPPGLGRHRGRRATLQGVRKTGDSPPTRHLALTHTQESVGRKTTKAIFHARGVGHQEKSEPLCMTCQTAEARKCLGRGLRCQPGTARSPWGARPSMRACYQAFQSEGRKRVCGILPPPHGKGGLATGSWPDCPAPGREPGCPEMSSGRLWGGSIAFSLLVCGLGARQGFPSPETQPDFGTPPRCPRPLG